MSSSDSAPVTLERIASALDAMGIVPFVASNNQVAAILPTRTIRIVLPEGRPAQGVADYPRVFHPSHAQQLAQTIAMFNATTYVPKVTTAPADQGTIGVRMHHCFNWVTGASDAQVNAEVSQFVLACVALMNRLDQMYPDQWAKEAHDA